MKFKLECGEIKDLEDIKFILKVLDLEISSDIFVSFIDTRYEDTAKRLFKKWYKV